MSQLLFENFRQLNVFFLSGFLEENYLIRFLLLRVLCLQSNHQASFQSLETNLGRLSKGTSFSENRPNNVLTFQEMSRDLC